MTSKPTNQTRKTMRSMPDDTRQGKAIPDYGSKDRSLPLHGMPENTITIGDTMVEVKPTKLRYQRNRTATLYKLLDLYPLPDILAMETGAFGEEDERDGDKAVFDWLVAVLDDENLVRTHYDEMTTETIERLLSIFKRVNKIDEKEVTQKKLLATAESLSTVPSR